MGTAIVQWRHLPGKIVVVTFDITYDFTCAKKHQLKKLPLIINLFWASNSCKTTLTLLYNKLIFAFVRISVFLKN